LDELNFVVTFAPLTSCLFFNAMLLINIALIQLALAQLAQDKTKQFI